MTMVKRVMGAVLVMVALVAAIGCSKPTAKENPAKVVAEEFYRDYFLDADAGRAYDLALKEMWGGLPFGASREAFIAEQDAYRQRNGRRVVPADAPLRITEYDRAGDWLYLVQDSRQGQLIWVTHTPDGWRVRKIMRFEEGMIIPWS